MNRPDRFKGKRALVTGAGKGTRPVPPLYLVNAHVCMFTIFNCMEILWETYRMTLRSLIGDELDGSWELIMGL